MPSIVLTIANVATDELATDLIATLARNSGWKPEVPDPTWAPQIEVEGEMVPNPTPPSLVPNPVTAAAAAADYVRRWAGARIREQKQAEGSAVLNAQLDAVLTPVTATLEVQPE